jgi:hypothetical protein
VGQKNQQGDEGYRTPRIRHTRLLRRIMKHSQIAHRSRSIIVLGNSKGDKHKRVGSGVTVYGTPDQILGHATTFKYQSGEVSGTCDRDKRYLCGSDGTA